MRKIITFLGRRPLKTEYSFNGNTYTGSVFAEAIRQFEAYDGMLVCCTGEAHAEAWPVLDALGDDRIQEVPIPRGDNPDEMWQIFKILLEHINEGDEVIFDITHGLRSLPFLVFLYAAFLKFARNVTISAIYYGALELGNSKLGIPAPVIDMTEFVVMLDWLTATSRFVDTGDGHSLSALLRRGIPVGELRGSDPAARELGNQLDQAARAIDGVSLALAMARPLEALQSAAALEAALQGAMPGIQLTARPFALLTGKLIGEYGQFALSGAGENANLETGLLLQLELVKWYLKRQHIVQAATLAREWLVSLLAFQFDAPMLDYGKGRKLIEQALSNAVGQAQSPPRKGIAGSYDAPLQAHPLLREIVSLWSRMTELRNDIAHCGMRLDAKSAEKLKRDVEKLLPDLDRMAASILDS